MNRSKAESLFKRPASNSETKSANTDKTARSITETEASERILKTQKLKEARLAVRLN